MNKAAVIGGIVAVAIGIIIVSSTISMESTTNDNELGLEDVLEVEIVEEPIPKEVEEAVLDEELQVSEEVTPEEEISEEETGRDLSVEFSESIGLKSP